MRRIVFSVVCLVIALACLLTARPARQLSSTVLAASSTMNPACIPPTTVAANPEETAWRLFVAATCPVNNAQYPYIAWERWIEQNQLYGGSTGLAAFKAGGRPRFHMSPLARFLQEQAKNAAVHPEQVLPQSANQDCNKATWSKRTICEEARLNSVAQSYVTSNGLTTLDGQVKFILANKPFDFSKPSVEIKADWIQLTSCNNLPTGVHVEKVDTLCYALGGIHLISKLVDKWIWATFEPQNASTNPQRCVVLGCKDRWGSTPATSSGTSTQLSKSLAALMAAANLAQEWKNYRLDGVQVDFTDGKGNPTILGNSIIEGDNAGNPTLMKSSSCITCHDLSTINKAKGGEQPAFIVGPPASVPSGDVRRDFVWSLSLAQ